MICRECWDDPCTCEPEPLEDFENGYCTELAPRWPTPSDWHERANADPFCERIWFKAMSDAGSRLEALLMRSSPVMARLGESARPFVEAGSPLSTLLPEAPRESVLQQVMRGLEAGALKPLYRSTPHPTLQRVVFDEMANYSPRMVTLHPAQYAYLAGNTWPVKWVAADELVALYPEKPKGNRATRRARAKMQRRR